MIYCGTNQFQQKFSETYRAMNSNEDLNSIKKRHSNFHHFGKYLKESVIVFGTEYYKGNIHTMYHGISTEMVFNGTQSLIFGVLSTTSSWTVAVQFSANQGLILELVPDIPLKYFNCCWLSRYSNESEILFVGGLAYMNFMNITNSIHGWESKAFIMALRYIDSMTNGNYFDKDPSIVHKMTEMCTKDIKLLGLTDVCISIKLLVKKLINHELNRYFPDKYNKWNKLHPYMDKLLHQICSQKRLLAINWRAFNVDMLILHHDGYIGYKYFKPFFFLNHGINLKLFNELFPEINAVKIYNLPCIDSKYLDYVLEFIANYKQSKISYFEFRQQKCDNRDISQKCNHYQAKFRNVGFNEVFNKRSLNAMIVRKTV